MDCNAKRYQSSRKAKDRKQRFLEIGKIDESCRCKMAAKEKNAFARAPKFSELPEEVVIEIMSYFSLKDLLRFRQVIQTFNVPIPLESGTAMQCLICRFPYFKSKYLKLL